MRVTIIGAGFSGSALAIELARNASSNVDICLVGIASNYARGVAYGDARFEHLLNVRARHLGVTADYPGDFADWLSLSESARDRFLPRLVYGEYLHSRLREAFDLSKATLGRVEQEVIALERLDQGFRVHLADGGAFFSDQVVLAVGALPPQALTGVGPGLTIHPSYIAWPWREGAVDRIHPEARVLIIGTGLTMADVVATLRRRGHQGAIHALSRHGLLPHSHGEEPPPLISIPPAVLHALNQRDLRLLLNKLRSLSTVVPDWRSLVDAMRPYIQDFWRGLPMSERARFLRHLRPYWESVRHRLAPAVAEDIQALRDSGQLHIRAGRLLRARRAEDSVTVSIRNRGQSDISNERFDVLLRATGFDTDIERSPDPLVSNLRESGLLAADPLGLGIQVTEHFRVVDRSGRPVRGLYAIGPLLRSQLWEITAIPELRVAASGLARKLLSPSGLAASPASNLTTYSRRVSQR
jgi:uncharacterized NAD(P)/FAD-binding protein YdhS